MAAPLGVERLEGRALLAADDFGGDRSTAFPIAPDDTGSGQVAGEIEVIRDVDMFRFVPPADGLIVVRMEALPGSALDTFLRIDDGNGVRITSNDDIARGSNRNSRVRFVAEAGQVYFAQARSSGGSHGGYTLTFEGPQPIEPPAASPTRLWGTIEDQNDLDLYRFVAPVDGVLEARLDGAPGGLDGSLIVYDVDDQRTIQPRADEDDGARDGVVRFAAEAGRTAYVAVSSFRGARTGDYTLTLSLPDPPSDPREALPIALPPAGPAVRPGSIEDAGDVDAFRFVAPRSGGVTIRQDALLGSRLDSSLSVSDDQGNLLAGDDDSRGTRDSLVRILADAGRAYTLLAAGFGTSTGPYTLTIIPDDFGDDLDSARPLPLSATDPLVQPGTIDADGDVDVFQFVAPLTGGVTLRQEAAPGSDLDSFAFVFDEAGRPIAFGNDNADRIVPKDSFLEFNVQEGRRYFVRAGAFPNPSGRGRFGDYLLRLSLGPALPADDHGNTFTAASPIPLVADFARLFGTIETPADVDLFRVVAPARGSLLARQDPTAGSTLQAVLTVFDGSGRLIATDFDSSVLRGRGGSALQWDVEAGREYFLHAAGFRGTTGGYDLSVFAGARTDPVPDDFGAEFAAAAPIPLNPLGSGSRQGAIDAAGDVDSFRFVALATGLLRLRLDAAPGSRLDPFLFAFDDSGSPLAQNDDIDGTTDRNSSIRLGTQDYPVVAGKTYFLKAAGFGASTGRYQLTIALLRDFDHPDRVFDDARDTLPAGPSDQDFRSIEAGMASSRQEAAIDSIGDVDVFRVVAQATGTLTVQQDAAPGIDLDSFLEAFDGQGALIAGNNDDKGARDSAVQFNVTAGQVYFLRAGAFGGFTPSGPNIGPYTLLLRVAQPVRGGDVGDTFATAATLILPPAGSPDLPGEIEIPGDVDVFRFTVPATGTLTLRQGAAPGSGLDSFLAAFDDTRDLIASNDDAPGSLDSLLQFDVQEGREYFLRASGFGPSVGRYLLSFLPGATVPPDAGDDPFASARRVDIDGKLLTATVFGTVDEPADGDVFRFVAPRTGPLLIRQEWTAGSRLDSFVFAFDDQRRLIASSDDDGPLPDAAVVVNLARGQVFYVRAASSAALPGPSRLQTGGYRLSVVPLADDFGDTFDEARAIEPDETRAVEGTIEVSGDVDLFEFVAPATGRLSIRLLARPGSGLDPVLVAFDDARAEIARSDDAAPEEDRNSRVQLNVTAGRRYFLRASGYGITAGAYLVAFDPIAADDFGSDFASATTVDLSSSGAGEVSGTLEDSQDVDVFRLEVPADRRLVVELTPEPGTSPTAELRAFTILEGIPTQVASRRGGPPGPLQFDAEPGRSYFLRVDAMGRGAGGYRLTIHADEAAGPSLAIREAGKGTFAELRESFLRNVPRIGPAPGEAQRAADAISDDLVRRFLAGLDGRPLTTDYLLLWLDPVDFRTTDPQSRQAGYTADQGAINEQGGGFYSGNGDLELLITPRASVGRSSLVLIGVGPARVLFGARLITADGRVLTPSVTFQGPLAPVSLPVQPQVKASLLAILDFPTTMSPDPAPTPPSGPAPTPAPDPSPTPPSGPAPTPPSEPAPTPAPDPAPTPPSGPAPTPPSGPAPTPPSGPAPTPPSGPAPTPPSELAPTPPSGPAPTPPSGPAPAPVPDPASPPAAGPASGLAPDPAPAPTSAAPTPGGHGASPSSVPERAVTAGLAAALQIQILAGGGLATDSTPSPDSGSAPAGGIVLTEVLVRLVSGGLITTTGEVSGAGQGGSSLRDVVTARDRALSALLDSLWNASGPLRGAWETLRGAAAAFLLGGRWPRSFDGWIEVLAGSAGLLERAAMWESPEMGGGPIPGRVQGRFGPARDAAAAVPADAPRGAEDGRGLPGGEEPAAAAGEDVGGGSRASVAALVAASALGIIRAHSPDGRAPGGAISRREDDRRPGPARPRRPGRAAGGPRIIPEPSGGEA